MKKIKLFIPALFLVILLIPGCSSNSAPAEKQIPVRIAVGKAVPEEAYSNYVRWIKHGDSMAVHFDLYHLDYDSALALLKTCDGLLLTGGTDIYPGRYGKEGDTARCWEPDFKRDTLEALIFRTALKEGMPIMGICRGLQVINVEMGGTLYIDLPSDLDTIVTHRVEDGYGANHEVSVVENTLLAGIAEVEAGVVNSAHHQGIEALGNNLVAMAHSADGLTESIAIGDTSQYLLGVQWHPERMDYSNPLSGKLAIRFLEEAKKYKTQRNHE